MTYVLLERLRQGHRTLPFPPTMAERFRGRPELDPSRCPEGCASCREACPTGALTLRPLRLDLGACLVCGCCGARCPAGALRFTRDHRLAARSREDLVIGGGPRPAVPALEPGLRRLLGRSLKLRQVSAGGCGGCEAELNALANVEFDAARFGIRFVASPRHADGVVVTGPVTANMELALRETWAATPGPKILVAVGACAISGGLFAGAGATCDGVPRDLPTMLYIPGCPPHPMTVIDGLMRLLGRLPPD